VKKMAIQKKILGRKNLVAGTHLNMKRSGGGPVNRAYTVEKLQSSKNIPYYRKGKKESKTWRNIRGKIQKG